MLYIPSPVYGGGLGRGLKQPLSQGIIFLILALLWLLSGFASPASAKDPYCNNLTKIAVDNCNPMIQPGSTTALISTSKCAVKDTSTTTAAPSTAGTQDIVTMGAFSAAYCRVENITKNLTTGLWCSIEQRMEPTVSGALTIYLTCMGILLLLGIIEMRTGEIMKIVFKIALVWAFATSGALAIGIVHNFFLAAIESGTQMMFTFAKGNDAVQGVPQSVAHSMDAMLSSIIATSNPLANSKGGVSVLSGIMGLSSGMPLGISVGGFLVMSSLYALIVFIKAMIANLFCILGIAFLSALLPIFVIFALFETTRPLFDNWLTAMISFVLQPVLLFGFLIFMQKHLEKNMDAAVCVIQQHIVECNNTSYASDGSRTQIAANQFCFASEPCTGADAAAGKCKFVNPYDNWDQAVEVIQNVLMPVAAQIVLLFMTNAFIGWLPILAHRLSNGAIAPIVGGAGYVEGYSRSQEDINYTLFTGFDNAMARFNQTGGLAFVQRRGTGEPYRSGDNLTGNDYEFSIQAFNRTFTEPLGKQAGKMGFNQTEDFYNQELQHVQSQYKSPISNLAQDSSTNPSQTGQSGQTSTTTPPAQGGTPSNPRNPGNPRTPQ